MEPAGRRSRARRSTGGGARRRPGAARGRVGRRAMRGRAAQPRGLWGSVGRIRPVETGAPTPEVLIELPRARLRRVVHPDGTRDRVAGRDGGGSPTGSDPVPLERTIRRLTRPRAASTARWASGAVPAGTRAGENLGELEARVDAERLLARRAPAMGARLCGARALGRRGRCYRRGEPSSRSDLRRWTTRDAARAAPARPGP